MIVFELRYENIRTCFLLSKTVLQSKKWKHSLYFSPPTPHISELSLGNWKLNIWHDVLTGHLSPPLESDFLVLEFSETSLPTVWKAVVWPSGAIFLSFALHLSWPLRILGSLLFYIQSYLSKLTQFYSSGKFTSESLLFPFLLHRKLFPFLLDSLRDSHLQMFSVSKTKVNVINK